MLHCTHKWNGYIKGHMNVFSFSPDSKLLATGTSQGMLLVVDIAKGSIAHLFQLNILHQPTCVAWANTQDLIVGGTNGQIIKFHLRLR